MNMHLWNLLQTSKTAAAVEVLVPQLAGGQLPRNFTTAASVGEEKILLWAAQKNWKAASLAVRTVHDADVLSRVAELGLAGVAAALVRNPDTPLEALVRMYRRGDRRVRGAVERAAPARHALTEWLSYVSDEQLDLYLDATGEELFSFLATFPVAHARALAHRVWRPLDSRVVNELADRLTTDDDYLSLAALVCGGHVPAEQAAEVASTLVWNDQAHLLSSGPIPRRVVTALLVSPSASARHLVAGHPLLTRAEVVDQLSKATAPAPAALLAHPRLPRELHMGIWQGRTPMFPGALDAERLALLRNPNLDPAVLALVDPLDEDDFERYGEALAVAPTCPSPQRAVILGEFAKWGTGTRACWKFSQWEAFNSGVAALARCGPSGLASEVGAAARAIGSDLLLFAPEVAAAAGLASSVLARGLMADDLLRVRADAELGEDTRAWEMLASLLPGWDGTIDDLLDAVKGL